MNVPYVLHDFPQKKAWMVIWKFTLTYDHVSEHSVRKDLKLQLRVEYMREYIMELSRTHVLFVERLLESQVV